MKNSHKFFSNDACAYFPCHQNLDRENFNCLFCFCPLYSLGDKCGGHFTYNAKGVKNCTNCVLPHQAEYYDTIIAKLK
ncbi:MAG: cysteine-rich small domain-containing protein [Sporomusaceae bacterium]|jgi:Zn-finger protein|nr:cysteine-rich small domain-containing protein [Sporomusaceae bacterium]